MKIKKDVTPEQVWASIAELVDSQKKTDAQIERTDRQIEDVANRQKKTEALIEDLVKSQKETDQQLRETDRQQKKTDAQIEDLAKSQKETDQQLRETDRQLRKTDRRFNSQWGKLVESLVRGNLAKLFSQRNMSVRGTSQRVEGMYNQKQYEFDILVRNGEDLVVVEVKTTLKVKDVNHFLNKLKDFKKALPEYQEKKICGAMAYLVADEGSRTYAQNKKLFVIRATGNSASIINPMDFRPRIF